MQKRQTNYYQMLGLAPEVTALEIKRAYRALVKNHHPDVDYHGRDVSERDRATEFMMQINEAYETLIDKSKRAAYDTLISTDGLGRRMARFTDLDESENREVYLRMNFHPARQSMLRVMKKYNRQLSDLSLDIYDDELVATFEKYVDEVEDTLRKASHTLSARVVPGSLDGAVTMMRYSIAQAVDGLDEMRRFCQNYDYDHLHMAGNLFRESSDLSKQGLQLSKR
ncbi:MAG: J domain-containing protein [Candidatus Melainabacteria bacterium]|nr:J domain-containing protein [Candidatus Melainabacteria bacterium]